MQKVIVGLGELLWDMLPSGKRLGGAPANFTVMSSRLGNRGVIASRLGSDSLAGEARQVLKAFPADLSLLQSDTIHPTGTVGVEIRGEEPHYIIHEPAAWDFMEWTSEWRALAQSADAVCFGSLAQRNPASRATIREFLSATRPGCVRVFDVNLRPPFFSVDVIGASLASATIFKLNEVEMPEVLAMLGLLPPDARAAGNGETGKSEAGLLAAARSILRKYPVKLVAVTMGDEGSILAMRDAHHRHHGVPIAVADTVGAGDAFTAALVQAYLAGASLAGMNEAGNRWGGWVASQRGAMPPLDPATLAAVTAQIADAASRPGLS